MAPKDKSEAVNRTLCFAETQQKKHHDATVLRKHHIWLGDLKNSEAVIPMVQVSALDVVRQHYRSTAQGKHFSNRTNNNPKSRATKPSGPMILRCCGCEGNHSVVRREVAKFTYHDMTRYVGTGPSIIEPPGARVNRHNRFGYFRAFLKNVESMPL